jgi:hypothetical protein
MGGGEMTLVKLDSGDYINTDKIEIISKTENINTGKNSTFVMPRSGLYALISNSNTVNLTTSDRDRIVEAMGGDYESRQKATAKIAKDIMDDDPDYDELKAGLS